MLNKNDCFIGCETEYDKANIVLFGAPFDGTTSYRPGTRFGPREIRAQSFGIETYSPYCDKDLLDCRICDAGDLDLPFGNTQRVLDEIEHFTTKLLANGKLPMMLGGEHLVTLGTVKAVAAKYPNLHILHFDAHADLRQDYLGETLSHATVMHRIWDIVGDEHIFQFGIRSGEKEEFEFAKAHTTMQKFSLDGLDETVKKLQGVPVYLSIDLDVLDPSVFPGTGTPEAGGITFKELLAGIALLNGLSIVGGDINELSPVYDQSGVSTAVACKTLREVLLLLQR